jgi:preprotein translocase subunit SecG
MLLAELSWGQFFLAFAILAVCSLLILIVLLQQGSTGGLAGAFGGGGASGAFGAKTGDVFTVITVSLALSFLLFAVIGNYVFRPADAPITTSNQVAPAPGGAEIPLPDESDSSVPDGAADESAG